MAKIKKTNRPRVFPTLRSALLLRCPRCGAGGVFDGLFHMRAECSECRLKFEREQGFFVGAIYVNYAFTVLIATAGFFLLDHYAQLSLPRQLALWGAFAIVFPIVFFRHSRSLWLGVAYLFDPGDEPRLRAVIK
jgi:uncharacterized protein (DUF983 family)